MKINEFLSNRHVQFERMPHPTTYSANRVAQTLHVSGREMAKTVVLRTGHGYALAVLPASHRIDLERLRQALQEEQVEMATEEEMDRIFPDCETGAMPPFGSLYHLPTVVDDALTRDERIVFEAQNHQEAICMAYRDYEALEHPRHGCFAVPC